jgi:glycosyltransferase involved in cell wall biosynthesis
VQGVSEVLRGQAIRSGGAIPYVGFAEFEGSVNYLLAHPEKAQHMGAAGHEYVRNTYDWEVVLSRFEETLELAKSNYAKRRLKTTPLR